MACEPSTSREIDETEVQGCAPGERKNDPNVVSRKDEAVSGTGLEEWGWRWRPGQDYPDNKGRMGRGDCPCVRSDEMVHVRWTCQPGSIQVSTHCQQPVLRDVLEDLEALGISGVSGGSVCEGFSKTSGIPGVPRILDSPCSGFFRRIYLIAHGEQRGGVELPVDAFLRVP